MLLARSDEVGVGGTTFDPGDLQMVAGGQRSNGRRTVQRVKGWAFPQAMSLCRSVAPLGWCTECP